MNHPVTVHLIDGTYELFRHFFAVPSHTTAHGREVGAVRGVAMSMLALLDDGATHIGIATDHVVESFRNELFDGYKTGDGIDPTLAEQFGLLEEVLVAMGFSVWPMIDGEADDALATAASIAAADVHVERVLICTPDKDLAQCVGGKVRQFDRRAGIVRDAEGVREKFGVDPASIPDYLALVGDTADGFPGLKGWGAKSTATVLARYGHLDAIPHSTTDWDISVRGAAKLVERLIEDFDDAVLFRTLATLRSDSDEVTGNVADWKWNGPTDEFQTICDSIDAPRLCTRAQEAAERRNVG